MGLDRRVEPRSGKFTFPYLDVTACGLPSSLVPMGIVSLSFTSGFYRGFQSGVFRLQGERLLVRFQRELLVRLVLGGGEVLGQFLGEFAQDDPTGSVFWIGLQ